MSVAKLRDAVTEARLLLALAIVCLLLALSIWGNVTQWADHRAYVKAEAARLEAAAMKAGLQVTASLAKAKQKDDPKLVEAVNRIDARTRRLEQQKRPAPLPAQCAPGQARMDAVNAGADT